MTDDVETHESATPAESPPEVSKSERKRQALGLQKLGARLTELNPGALADLDLPAKLADAIALHQRITSREAKRRQLQYIGALMRDYDTAPIQAALEALHGESASARYELHQIEIWRDRLVADPAALTEYLDSHPNADRQRLRHALQKIARSPLDPQRRGASRALFRILREFEVPT
jgi:ribosome-associated protein